MRPSPKHIIIFRGTALLLAGCLAVVLYAWLSPRISKASSAQQQVFEAVWQTVNEEFFDPQFNGVDWQALRSHYAPLAAQTHSSEELKPVINAMLAELNTSHTHFYTQSQPEYYQIAGIFSSSIQQSLQSFLTDGVLQYTGIGIDTQEIQDHTFITGILAGSPAAKAGLQVGDQLITVDGQPFQPIGSFAGKAGQTVQVQIQRQSDGFPQEIAVEPQQFDPTTLFLEAMKASVEIIQRQGKSIGYVHIWSYASDIYQDQLEQELIHGRLRDVDGLVWDLRDGWGGAKPSYLNLFTAPVPALTFITRDGQQHSQNYRWQKPVVMLVNQGSRSGKEILAYGFRKYGVGKIVGSKTQGAVVAGRPYVMPDGSLLYLAVADVLVEGKRLEGKGIQPDIEVPFDIAYAQGRDPQKEKVIEVVLATATGR